MSSAALIPPYGGQLVDRQARGPQAVELELRARRLPALNLDPVEACDLHLIATGACSPLEGFMGRADYQAVLHNLHLASGLPWTIPVVLRVDGHVAHQVARLGEAALCVAGRRLGVIQVQEVYPVDLEEEAQLVYGTADPRHPGVAWLLGRPGWCVAGPVLVWQVPEPPVAAPGIYLTPRQSRAAFARRGWSRVAAFQTRNPGHRAHEYLQKCVLEWVDGLLIHPLVGWTKEDDLPATVRLRAYEILLTHYYPPGRVVLAPFAGAMRYAGPREAVFHAILRRNYGCSHFVVGRDHAGVGGYYGPFDAHALFDRFDRQLLGIEPVRFDTAFYCRRCAQMASPRTCPHTPAWHSSFSGTAVRRALAAGLCPPDEYTRPEVAGWLVAAAATSNGASTLPGAATTHRQPPCPAAHTTARQRG